MISKSLSFLVCTFFVFGGVSSVLGDPITNGSFESGLSGWGSSGNLNITSSQGTTDGSAAVAFSFGNLPSNGILFQTFATTPGVRHHLLFDFGKYSVNQAGVAARLQINMFDGTGFGGATLLDEMVEDFTPETGVSTPDASVYDPYSYSFIPTSALTTIRFTDISDAQVSGGGFDAMLDHVRVSAIPEPSTFVILIGIGSMACVLRRR